MFCDAANCRWEVGRGEDPERFPLECFERCLPDKPPVIRFGNFWGDDQPGGKAWKARNAATSAEPTSSTEHSKKATSNQMASGSSMFEPELQLSQNVSQQQGVFEDNISDGFDDASATETDTEVQARINYQNRGGPKGLQSRFHPVFQEALKIADHSYAAFRELESGLPDLLQRMETVALQEKEQKTGKAVDTSMGLELDRSTSNRRLKPYYSPNRSRKQPRTGKGPNSPEKDGKDRAGV